MKSPKKTLSRRRLGVILILLGVGLVAFVGYKKYTTNTEVAKKTSIPVSRQVMQIAEQVVKDIKPPPTTSALGFAYMASVYYDVIQNNTTADALYASQKILVMFFPEKTSYIEQAISKLAEDYRVVVPTDDQISSSVKTVVSFYSNRFVNDQHALPWNGKIPSGAGKWVRSTGVDPLTPRAGEWQRWNVKQNISAPPPPAYGSAKDLQELENTKQISASRNGQDVNEINFWGGAPGTESPSGVWQNQIFATLKNDLPKVPAQADKLYAEIQRDTAQTMSDAFMECWKIKYIYWTARPDMRDTSIKTAMRDPPFPSYISGHSTISKAVADVLSTIAPKHSKEFEEMALKARESRIKAGIHFEVDNAVGFDVGSDVASQTKANLQLKALL